MFLVQARVQAKQTRPSTEQIHLRPRRPLNTPTSMQSVRNSVLAIDKGLTRLQNIERTVTKEGHRQALSVASSPKAFWRVKKRSNSGLGSPASSSLLLSRLSSPRSGSRPLIVFESVL